MQPTKVLKAVWLGTAMLIAGLMTTQAQTTATWSGPASGGEWNTGANWNTGFAPLDSTTNALIGVGTNVSYNLPMTAAGFGGVTNRGTLNLNTNGFNCAAIVMNNTGAKLLINTGAVVTVTGTVGVTSNTVVTLTAGSSVTIGGSLLVGSGATGGTGGGTVGCNAVMTNNGAALTAAVTTLNAANQSVSVSSLLVINGGTNNLGNVTINRATGGNSAPNAFGADGVVINGGVVTLTNLSLPSNSHMTFDVTGGLVTNLGSVTLKMPTTLRSARFAQSGGFFVNPTTNIINLQPSASGAIALYQVTGGTNMVNGFQFGDAVPSAGTVTFTIGAPIYVGGGGIVSNGAVSLTASLNANGKLAASADWTNAVTVTLNGGVIDAQDVAGIPHNIYSTGALKTGALTKNGGGILTLTAANTPSSTTINAGTLALATNGVVSVGSLLTAITVASNATFDVSGLSGLGGFVLGSSQTLAGGGTVTGTFAAGVGSIVNPAGSSVRGTLNFATGLAATNAIFNFELTDDPTGIIKRNDFISITGDLNLGGTNTIAVTPVGSLGIGTYKLMHFTGSLNGDVTNLACSSGTLTNPPGSGDINLIVTSVRATANLVWRGDGAANSWDTAVTIDWLNGASLDRFYTGDTNTFNDTATNFTVNITGVVSPASASTVMINATNDYTFSGSGSIAGVTSLTKTNSGKLTIANTNLFTGGVNFKAGTVSVASLADDGISSPLGQTGTLLVDGGALEYTGPNYTWTRTITLGTTAGTVSTVNTLTSSGTIVGTGPLVKSGVGGFTVNNGANSYSGGTILNAGTLTINNATAAGAGGITLNSGTLAIGAVKPANTINVAGESIVSGGNAGGSTGIKNVTGSSNLVIAVTTGVFDLTGDMTAYAGTITFSNAGAGTVRFNGATGSALATWDLGISTMDLNIRTGSTINNFGALKGAAGTTLSGRGGSGNNGATTHLIGANGQNTTFDGIIQNGSGGGASTTAIVKNGAGTLTLSGANTYTGTTTVSNGVLALTGSGSIDNSPTINIVSGAAINVSARGDATLLLNSAQTLRGNGTVSGNLDNSGGGKISPGAAAGQIGQLTVTNLATLGGTLLMELNRTNAVMTNDVFVAASNILSGTLTVTNLGPTLVAGDRFVLISGPVSGAFATVNLPESVGSVTYTWTNKTAIDGSIQVLTVTTVNQTPTNITTVVNGGNLELSWPADHTGWHLQVQTNSLGNGLGANWVTIPSTDLVNSYTNTIDAVNGTVFYRMVYP